MNIARAIAPICLVLSAGTGQAEETFLPLGHPAPVCQPAPAPVLGCPAPTAPTTPPGQTQTPSNTQTPGQQNQPDTPRQNDNFSQAPEGGTSSADSLSPNMYGDAFGGSPLRIFVSQSPIVIPGTPGTPAANHLFGGTFLAGGTTVPATFAYPPGGSVPTVANPLVFTLANKSTTLPGVSTVFAPPFTQSSQGPVTVSFLGLRAGTTVPLQEQPQVSTAALQSAQSQFGPGGTLTQVSNTANIVNGGNPTGFAQTVANIATQYDYVTPGTPGTPAQVIQRPSFVLNIPNPSDGGVVGRTKIADDNSPLPRDRIIFGFDYFDSVPLGGASNNVSRFSPGFEKTFLDGDASIEVRFPFASTVSSDIVADGINSDGHTEFGNLNITLKGLLIGGPNVNVSAGLGIALPTGDDVHVSLTDGTPVARIHNDSVLLTPFIAYLLTPNDRLFFQNWYQFGFGTNGDRVEINPAFTGVATTGRLNDQTLLQIDAQLGYWLYRSEEREQLLRGLAPFVELHYNTTLGKPDTLTSGALVVGDPNLNFNEVNLTVGFTAQIENNLNVSVGAVLPLSTGENRTFDWQVGIRGSLFFGRTAQAKDRATQVSSF